MPTQNPPPLLVSPGPAAFPNASAALESQQLHTFLPFAQPHVSV